MGIIMNRMLAGTTRYNWYDILAKLDYCKKHSSKQTYDRVLKSLIRTALSVVVICLVYATVLICGMNYFDKQINSHISENHISYSFEKTGHISGGILYYIDNEKYEVDMSAYGYDADDYESGTDFSIYLDENRRVVDISPIDKNEITASDKMVYWMLGSTIGAAFVLVFYAIWAGYSKSVLNPGREWSKFGRWLKTKDAEEEWYYD